MLGRTNDTDRVWSIHLNARVHSRDGGLVALEFPVTPSTINVSCRGGPGSL